MGEETDLTDAEKKKRPLIALSEARLQLDSFDQNWGVLMIEGPDDWRLFRPRVCHPAQLIHCGGREMVLAAYRASTETDRQGMAFILDCDFEIPHRTVARTSSIIVTQNVDSESDLLELGLFEQIVTDALPTLLPDLEATEKIIETVKERVLGICQPLGQIRRVAKSHGVKTQKMFSELKYSRWRPKNSTKLNRESMIQKIGMALDPRFCGMSAAEFYAAVDAQPTGYQFCNGHDLVNAMVFILTEDFKSTITRDAVNRLLRGAAGEIFWDWSVTSRIERWEQDAGRIVFKDRNRRN